MTQKEILTLAAAAFIGLGLIVHALFPRYDWKVVGENGAVVLVYDRWSNYVQRAVYDDQGKIHPMEPYKPF